MNPFGRLAPWLLAAMIAGGQASGQEAIPKPEPAPATPRASKLSMSPAVACRRVDGLERYEPLPGASLTSEDKLKVYFRPIGYKVESTKTGYRASFTEDGRIRRKGEKAALSKEDKLMSHEARFESREYQIYLVNNIGLKTLPPGAYEFDIILHDALDAGSTATQTIPFTIVPLPKGDPAVKEEGPGEPESSTGPAESAKTKARSKGTRPLRPSRSPKS